MLKSTIREIEQRELFIREHQNSLEKLCCEVPVFTRSVDLVRCDLQSGLVTAIEFKLSNWKRAIAQVLDVALSFDYIEICVCKPKYAVTKQRILDECKYHGIGLYFYCTDTGIFERPLKPRKVKLSWKAHKSQIFAYLNEEML